jgi:hypothetical protein
MSQLTSPFCHIITSETVVFEVPSILWPTLPPYYWKSRGYDSYEGELGEAHPIPPFRYVYI